jgi:phosphatidylglycerol:prolipoprotein diacylglycerol transferase
MVAVAVMAIMVWLIWQNREGKPLKQETVYTIALVGIPSGIIFSKILHLIDHWNYYIQNPGKIVSGEGMTIWGAVLGATIGIWVFSRISRGFRFSLLGDMIAPGIILSQAIGRVGCVLNGCCYGNESHSPIAVIYTSPNTYAPVGVPILPVTTFEIIYDLIIFVLLFSLRGKLKPQGSLFAVYFIFYAAWRFGIDFFRPGTSFLFGLHEAQVIGLIVLLITVPFIILRTRLVKKEEPFDIQN